MPAPYPLTVQGLAYSYRDIKPTGLPGIERIKTFLRSINFTNAAEADHGHGATQKAFGKVSGPYKPTAEMELAEEGVDILLGLLPPEGYSDFLFSFMLVYAKAQTVPPFKKLRFNNFAVLGDRGDWSQGTTPLSARIPCYVETIQRDRGDGIWRCPINLSQELSQG
jgi:hypothetical protein